MRLLALLSFIFVSVTSVFSQPPGAWQLDGEVAWDDGTLVFSGKKSGSAEWGIPVDSDQSLTLNLAVGASMTTFGLLLNGEETDRFSIRKDKVGETLSIVKMEKGTEAGQWTAINAGPQDLLLLSYAIPEKAKLARQNLEDNQIKTTGWNERAIEMRVLRRGHRVEIYLDGVLIFLHPVDVKDTAALQIMLPSGDALTPTRSAAIAVPSQFVPLDLRAFTEGRAPTEVLEEKDGIPFLRPEGGKGVDLRKAAWPFAKELPSNFFAAYDSGPMFLHDLRVPTFWAPAQEYSRLNLLVRRTPDAAGQGERFSIRVGSLGSGSIGGYGQVLQHDYHAEIPKEPGEQVISIPLTEAIAQDLGESYQVSFNKEIRLSRRTPDPNRFEFRPLGLPPGVEILGATLERAPVQMRLIPTDPGNVFEGKKSATFEIDLENISAKPRDYSIVATLRDSGGGEQSEALQGSLKAGEKRQLPLTLSSEQWGYHDLSVRLQAGEQETHRKSTVALLPPDTRQHRAESAFGTWTFDGKHRTANDPDIMGQLLKRAGLRFGKLSTSEERVKWGVQMGFEAKAIDTPEKYKQWQELNPDALPVALLMHEHSISADHATRVPDVFTGRKPYQLNEKEKVRFDKLWQDQIHMAKLMREHFPEVHLRLGNGPLPTREEFLRAKFPPELFDSIGNEAGSYGRLPEAQPPDCVANNASIWMDHEMLKAYGYDKPVTQCYEVIYPSTNPGNLSPQDQAAYYIRHGLHSLAWGVPEIRFGCLDDVGNAYRFSNWGASGMMNPWPHLNPKPAYIAVATMTRMLDGAKYVKTWETASRSVYAVEFLRPDQSKLYVLWTLRGERDLHLAAGGSAWTLTDWEGNESQPALADGDLRVNISPMPVYLSGKGELTAITTGDPVYAEAPGKSGKVIAPLDSMENWEIQTEPDPVLLVHNPMVPRRPGNFQYKTEDGSLQIHAEEAPGPKTLPMVSALVAKTPIELPGQPGEIGIWVDGNSGWGRVIYELEDASGQKWISIGASQTGEVSEWMLDWLPAEFAKSGKQHATQADWNTNDVFGVSSINFDGWRYVQFALPGNYPGEKNPWPANSQWRSDKDGAVHYPLKLTRLIFELPENVLKLTSYEPVKDQTIRVKNLTVESYFQGQPKEGIYENEL